MPLRICPNQQILFVHEHTGYSMALHGSGTEVKSILIACPILNDLLPRRALPTVPGTYLWQGTLVEETDPESGQVPNRYWVGTVLPVSEADVTTIFTKFGDRTSAGQILIAAFRASSRLEESKS
ncbi:MAG: hypothetical protein H0W13_02385 [Nitrospirales bacterium]|nr:hypothetical protein [Nitrospirales bacterium]